MRCFGLVCWPWDEKKTPLNEQAMMITVARWPGTSVAAEDCTRALAQKDMGPNNRSIHCALPTQDWTEEMDRAWISLARAGEASAVHPPSAWFPAEGMWLAPIPAHDEPRPGSSRHGWTSLI
jgi:hypothetical protein